MVPQDFSCLTLKTCDGNVYIFFVYTCEILFTVQEIKVCKQQNEVCAGVCHTQHYW